MHWVHCTVQRNALLYIVAFSRLLISAVLYFVVFGRVPTENLVGVRV